VDALDVRFKRRELAAVVGRPGHGKTSVLVGLLTNWLLEAERNYTEETFVFYSFEEPRRFLARRMVSLLTCEEEPGGPPNEVRSFERDQNSRENWPSREGLLNVAWERSPRGRNASRLSSVRPGRWTTWWPMQEPPSTPPLAGVWRGFLVDYWQRIPPPGDGS